MTAHCYKAKSLRYCVKNILIKAGIIFLPLLFLLPIGAVGQYFNKRIDFLEVNQGGESGFSIEKLDDGNYVIFLGAFSTEGDNFITGRAIVDSNGNIISTMWEIDENGPIYIGHSNTSTKIAGGFVTCGSRDWFTSTLESVIRLNRYNVQGELLWTKEFGDQVYQSIGRAATAQANGNLAATGVMSRAEEGNSDAFLLITDSLGEQLDLKFYGGSEPDEFKSIYNTLDNGFILGGHTLSFLYPGRYNHYIVKTDSLGNQEWSKTIGTPRNDCPAAVIQTMDSNYVFCGCWNNYDASPNAPITTLYLAKLGQNGQILWQKEFSAPTLGARLYAIKELPEGGLISAGNRIGGLEAVLLRTDADGNELWSRIITHPSIINGFTLFHDVIIEEDGGFVGTGYVVGTASDPQPGQDLWVFRTDSMGCLVPGCHLTDNIELHSNEVAVSLYPNPVKDQLSVHIKAGELPNGAKLELYDMQGRQHLNTVIEKGAITYVVDMRDLASGIYLLHCTTPTEMLWTGKVVKE